MMATQAALTLDLFSGYFKRMENKLRCCFSTDSDVEDDGVPGQVQRDRLGACRADFDRMAVVMQKLLAN